MAHPSPTTWTLRLKSHRTTILLHIDPLTSFSAIKRTLHTALQETGLQATSHGPEIPLPASPEDIKFGRPLDPLDPSQGFELGEWEAVRDEEIDVDDEDVDVKGKGKGKGKASASARKSGGSGGDMKECPKGVGLKDGAVLAFRWEGDDVGERADWGVQMASFEDAYGVQNEGDVGERGEFEG